VLNPSKVPPFTIEDETDGGEELRAKYRYLDLRRTPVRNNLVLRHKLAQETRRYLDGQEFLEVETPVLIKSTPEGARDFVVPSRMNPGEFYALPQSPQTFKQLLMVSGFERYFQIVKCFRDEDLRADRQPEFTQIDCEMAFVTQEDVLNTFEGLIRHLFKTVKGIDIGEVPRMTYDEAMRRFGSDKPDIRFGMEFTELNELAQNRGFQVFDQSELVVGLAAPGLRRLDPQAAGCPHRFCKAPADWHAGGLVWVRYNADGSLKSSVDKFYGEEDLKAWAQKMQAQPGDLLLLLSGDGDKTRKALSELRLHHGQRAGPAQKRCVQSPLGAGLSAAGVG
jgi:aspartyl-tRNA synthetase